MKIAVIGLLTIAALSLSACKENKEQVSTSTTSAQHDMNGMNENNMNANHMNTNNNLNADMPMHDNIEGMQDGKSSANLESLRSSYIQLTAALSNDDDNKAAIAAKKMVQSLGKVDQSSFSADQKKEYADIASSLKEHSEHITENVGNIVHQREHLALMSTDFYDLLKDFGTSKPMYKIFCPMYNKKKGAFWLSDSREVKNPYYGKEMMTCGEVQEEIK